jgi:hypothetical protein
LNSLVIPAVNSIAVVIVFSLLGQPCLVGRASRRGPDETTVRLRRLLETARELALERGTLAARWRPGAARGATLGDRALLSALFGVRENRDAVLKGAEFLEGWAVLPHVPEATAVVTDDVSGFCMVGIEAVFERESVEVGIFGSLVANNERELCRRNSLKVSSSSETTSN